MGHPVVATYLKDAFQFDVDEADLGLLPYDRPDRRRARPVEVPAEGAEVVTMRSIEKKSDIVTLMENGKSVTISNGAGSRTTRKISC